MAKNLMPEVSKMLGVELGEAFYIKDFGTLYRFTLTGLEYKNDDDKRWRRISSCLIEALIKGNHEIEKLPWKPKEEQTYYYIAWRRIDNTGEWKIRVETTFFTEFSTPDNLRVAVGNCFRTKEEAEAAKFDAFERLTGKKWEEVSGKAGEAE